MQNSTSNCQEVMTLKLSHLILWYTCKYFVFETRNLMFNKVSNKFKVMLQLNIGTSDLSLITSKSQNRESLYNPGIPKRWRKPCLLTKTWKSSCSRIQQWLRFWGLCYCIPSLITGIYMYLFITQQVTEFITESSLWMNNNLYLNKFKCFPPL